jgi:hypothetical protein
MEGGAVSLALWPFIPPGLNLLPRDEKASSVKPERQRADF